MNYSLTQLRNMVANYLEIGQQRSLISNWPQFVLVQGFLCRERNSVSSVRNDDALLENLKGLVSFYMEWAASHSQVTGVSVDCVFQHIGDIFTSFKNLDDGHKLAKENLFKWYLANYKNTAHENSDLLNSVTQLLEDLRKDDLANKLKKNIVEHTEDLYREFRAYKVNAKSLSASLAVFATKTKTTSNKYNLWCCYIRYLKSQSKQVLDISINNRIIPLVNKQISFNVKQLGETAVVNLNAFILMLCFGYVHSGKGMECRNALHLFTQLAASYDKKTSLKKSQVNAEKIDKVMNLYRALFDNLTSYLFFDESDHGLSLAAARSRKVLSIRDNMSKVKRDKLQVIQEYTTNPFVSVADAISKQVRLTLGQEMLLKFSVSLAINFSGNVELYDRYEVLHLLLLNDFSTMLRNLIHLIDGADRFYMRLLFSSGSKKLNHVLYDLVEKYGSIENIGKFYDSLNFIVKSYISSYGSSEKMEFLTEVSVFYKRMCELTAANKGRFSESGWGGLINAIHGQFLSYYFSLVLPDFSSSSNHECSFMMRYSIQSIAMSPCVKRKAMPALQNGKKSSRKKSKTQQMIRSVAV
jgi:hypothetical protein